MWNGLGMMAWACKPRTVESEAGRFLGLTDHPSLGYWVSSSWWKTITQDKKKVCGPWEMIFEVILFKLHMHTHTGVYPSHAPAQHVHTCTHTDQSVIRWDECWKALHSGVCRLEGYWNFLVASLWEEFLRFLKLARSLRIYKMGWFWAPWKGAVRLDKLYACSLIHGRHSVHLSFYYNLTLKGVSLRLRGLPKWMISLEKCWVSG